MKNSIYFDVKKYEEESRKKFGNRFNYSKAIMVGSVNKIKVICNECGTEFEVNAWAHLHSSKYGGCPVCTQKYKSKHMTKNNQWFFEEMKNRRDDKGEYYDYSKVIYEKSTKNIEIICPKHGPFKQTPWSHLCGSGCPVCGYERSTKSHTDNWDSYFEKMKKQRYDKCTKYDYSRVVYKGCCENIEIICPKHGSFWQTPSMHLHNCGCPKCKASKLEVQTRLILEDLNVKFTEQARFDWLGRQSLDFYLPDYNIAIECQGIQHCEPSKFFSSRTLEEQKKADTKKRQACYRHGVKVRYIKYSEADVRSKLIKMLSNVT